MTFESTELGALYTKGWFPTNDNKIIVITTEKLKELGVEIEFPKDEVPAK